MTLHILTGCAAGARTLVGIALASGALLALAGCETKGVAAAPVPSVVAQAVHPRSRFEADALRYPVEAAARYSNAMSFRVSGKLIERTVRLGDTVRKGQMVARLDPIDAERQAAAARAALDAADHRLLFAKEQLERDTAQSAQNLIAASQLEQT